MTTLTAKEMIALVEDSYFYNVDNKNLDATVDCFTEDAELTVQTAHVTHRGHDEIRRMFGDFMRDIPLIYHGDFSHVVDIDKQLIASQFLARNELADGSEVATEEISGPIADGAAMGQDIARKILGRTGPDFFRL